MAIIKKVMPVIKPLCLGAAAVVTLGGLATHVAQAIPKATGANAPNATYNPGNNPCTNTSLDSAAANAFQSAFNKGIQNANPAPITRGSSTTIKLGDPFGWNVWKRQNYTAAATATTSISGANTGSATITVKTTSCNYTPGSFNSSGTLTTVMKWPSIEVEITTQLTGFFIKYYQGTNVDIKVSDLILNLPATYTIKSNSDKTAQVTEFRLNNCTSSGNVTATVQGSSSSQAAQNAKQKVQDDVNKMGAQMCSSIQTKVNAQLPYTFSLTDS